MEADGRRAGVEGAGVGADHALAEVGRSAGARRSGSARRTRPSTSRRGRGGLRRRTPRRSSISASRRRVADPQVAFASRPQGIAEAADDVASWRASLHIAGGEAADLGLAAFVVVPELDARAVEEGDEEAVDGGRPLEAAGGKVELLDRPAGAAGRRGRRRVTCVLRGRAPRWCRRRRRGRGSRGRARVCRRGRDRRRRRGRCGRRRR